jgi:hypothetical protein
MKAKELRGQLRQIVKEMFVELVSTELYVALQKENKAQLDLIHKLVRESLERIDDRQKDVLGMIMREFANGRPTIPALDPEKAAE